MTTRRQILNLLNGTPYPRTDNQIADAIDRPVPSVRRTRLQMEHEGLLTMHGFQSPYEWALTGEGRMLAGSRR